MTTATLDRVFEALASETRREIIAAVATRPTETPELGRRFSVSKQALHRHISVLEEAGVVERTKLGRVHRIALAPAPLGDVSTWVTTITEIWQQNLDRLADVLDDET